MIPMGCKWNHFYQLDPGAYNCSAKEARLRWPAEAIFGRVLNTPSLQGTIPHHFLAYVEQAHAVAYLNLFCCNFHVKPKIWDEMHEHWNKRFGSKKNKKKRKRHLMSGK